MLLKLFDLVHLDFEPRHQQPSGGRVVLATIAAIIGSLLADVLIVAATETLIPSTKTYAHFQLANYAELTIIGVIIACIAWPITTRITSQPRWMFFWMAVAVTLVLWLPDVYLLVSGQQPTAVAALFVMHLAIALVAYNALVRLAPIRVPRRAPTHRMHPVRR